MTCRKVSSCMSQIVSRILLCRCRKEYKASNLVRKSSIVRIAQDENEKHTTSTIWKICHELKTSGMNSKLIHLKGVGHRLSRLVRTPTYENFNTLNHYIICQSTDH